LVDLVSAGAIGGMFWGLLFGMIFFVPLFGMAIVPWGEAPTAPRRNSAGALRS
jgi:uncharacterized membrane protein